MKSVFTVCSIDYQNEKATENGLYLPTPNTLSNSLSLVFPSQNHQSCYQAPSVLMPPPSDGCFALSFIWRVEPHTL